MYMYLYYYLYIFFCIALIHDYALHISHYCTTATTAMNLVVINISSYLLYCAYSVAVYCAIVDWFRLG